MMMNEGVVVAKLADQVMAVFNESQDMNATGSMREYMTVMATVMGLALKRMKSSYDDCGATDIDTNGEECGIYEVTADECDVNAFLQVVRS